MPVFFMLDSKKAVNAIIERIPRELRVQFLTDYMTKLLKLATGETKNTGVGVIPDKHGIIVAFARKT
jgi:hypothetical protein